MKPGVLATVIVLGTVSIAHAQSPTQGVFVSGTAFAAINLDTGARPVQPVSGLGSIDSGGTTAGGGGGIGTYLTPRWSVRFEFAFAGETDASSTLTSAAFTETLRVQSQIGHANVLVGYHPAPRGRVEMGYLGGVAFVHQRQHFFENITQQLPLPPGSFVPPFGLQTEAIVTNYRQAAVVGLDVAVSLSKRCAIVPGMRALAFSGTLVCSQASPCESRSEPAAAC